MAGGGVGEPEPLHVEVDAVRVVGNDLGWRVIVLHEGEWVVVCSRADVWSAVLAARKWGF